MKFNTKMNACQDKRVKTFFFICIFLSFLLNVDAVQASAAYSQTKSFTFKMEQKTVQEVIDYLESKSEFVFFFYEGIMDTQKKVSLSVKDGNIYEVLDKLLEDTSIGYEIKDRQIVLKPKEKQLSAPSSAATPIKIRGKVIDDLGEPLPGATIVIKGTPKGVTTDVDGSFTIEVEIGTELEISYIGMETQVVTVKNKQVLNIQLKPKVDELEEVTVVAFAKQKKESVLASVSTVKPSELKAPTSNLTTALAGRIAGVISYQRSGEPGADDADFFVRGVTTFGYKKDPLILIDGIELTSRDLANLQVDDIASFSIMKDATATALYGSRGANGVILVTTKGGAEGPSKISARFEVSHSAPTKTAKWADPITYMNMENEASLYTNGTLMHAPQKIENTRLGMNPNVYPAVDWYDQLFKESTTNYRGNINISGGGTKAKYYIAGSFSKDEGSLKAAKQNNFNNNINLLKYLLRANVDVNISKTTTATVRLHGTMEDYSGPISEASSIYKQITQTSPVLYPAYYEPDEANRTTPYVLYGNYEDGRYFNPYAEMTKGYKDRNKSLMLAQVELRQDLSFITKGLKLRGMFNTNRRSEYGVNRQYNPFYYTAGSYDPLTDTYILNCINPIGSGTEVPKEGTDYLKSSESSKVVSTNTYLEAALNYDRTFREKHDVSGLLVFMMRSEIASGDAGDVQMSLPSRNMGLSGRFTYAYDSRYFLEANFGYNGSERFHESERWGFFPSAGLGYLVSNEPFWNDNLKKVVNKLKLKATYGLVGNDAIGSAEDRFFYLSKVNMNDSSYAYTWGSMWNYTVNGVKINRYANPNITWEISHKTNLGLELGLFDVLELQVDVFRDNRERILMTRASIPSTMGLSNIPKSNVGEALSEGIDMSLDYNQAFRNGLWLSGRFNFTYSRGKYKVYEEPDYSSTPWRSKVGQSMGQEWGYVAERLFIDEQDIANSPVQFGNYKPGDIKYKDINNDGIISEADQVPIGYPTSPEIVYGFGLSSGWKGFDFSFFFQGLAHESFWIDYHKTTPFIDENTDDSFIGRNQLLDIIAQDHWSEANRNPYAFWPRLATEKVSNNSYRNTWFMRDGSFLRLKSLEFGYTLPQKLTRKIGLKNLRIYYSGTNLLCFSKFDLWDPEMAGNGFGYPVQRVNNIGVNFSF